MISNFKWNLYETEIELKYPGGIKAVSYHIFKENDSKVEGSLEWHLKWVKSDLEARKVIMRIRNKLQLKYCL